MNKYEIIEEYKKYIETMGIKFKDKFVGDYILHLYNIGKISVADFEKTEKEIKNIIKEC